MCENCGYGSGFDFEDFLARLQNQYETQIPDPMIAAQKEIDSFKAKTIRSIPIADKVTLHILDETHSGRIHTIVKVLTELQNNYPAPGKVDVYYPTDVSDLDNAYGAENSQAQAATTIMNNGRIAFGPDRVLSIGNLAFTDRRSYDGWHMPAHNMVQEGPAVIVHEWGHVTDIRPENSVQDTLISAGLLSIYGDVDTTFFNSLSDYGKKNEKESYAECFTEWVITSGETSNFATKWYAKEYDWPKANLSLPRSRAHHSDHDGYYTNRFDHDGYYTNHDSYYQF